MRNYFSITHEKSTLRNFLLNQQRENSKTFFPPLKYSNFPKNGTQCVRSKEKLFSYHVDIKSKLAQIIMKYLGLVSIILLHIDILWLFIITCSHMKAFPL